MPHTERAYNADLLPVPPALWPLCGEYGVLTVRVFLVSGVADPAEMRRCLATWHLHERLTADVIPQVYQ